MQNEQQLLSYSRSTAATLKMPTPFSRPRFEHHSGPCVTDRAKGMDTLLRHAYESPSSRTAFAAMRVVANAMRLKPQTRQIFVDSGLAPKACRYMKIENWNDEFLGARILFLATYDTNIDLTKLIDEHQLATRILDRLHVHAKRLKKTKSKPEEMEEEALAETLKLMFNVTYHCPNRVASFSPSAADLVALLFKMDFFLPDPLDPFFKAICNALLNVDMSAGKLKSSLFPKSEVGKVPNRIIHLLGACTEMYDDAGLESLVAPVVSLVKKMHEYAPEKDGEVFRERLLPTVEGRRNVQV